MSTEKNTNITDELNRLGAQLSEALRLAWESDERRKLQAEISEGAQRLGQQLEGAMRQARENTAAQKVKAQAEAVVDKARNTEVVEEAVNDVRQGLLTGLQTLNRELSKLVERLEPQAAATAPAAPVEPEFSPAPDESSSEPPAGPTVQI